MSSLRWLTTKFVNSRQPWLPKDFSAKRFPRIIPSQSIDEETIPGYLAERYYPVHIGQTVASRYQVVGKLGYGATSTVWLARDLTGRQHVALKIYITSSTLGPQRELAAYERLKKGPVSHPGRECIRPLLDSFLISGPDGEHQCLVHPPLWGSLLDLMGFAQDARLNPKLLCLTLLRIFTALDYTHKARVIHSDLNHGNIMMSIGDPSILDEFENAELNHPSPRKETGGRTIYLSRQFPTTPNACGAPVLCDFGSAELGDEEHRQIAQPTVCRSPEVILGAPWSYEIDIWNVGCLAWDFLQGDGPFTGVDEYDDRKHLAEMVALIGPPPKSLLAVGSRSSDYFSEDGRLQPEIQIPPRVSFSKLEGCLQDKEDNQLFLNLIQKMLKWNPADRCTAEELIKDEWISKHLRG